MGLEKQEHPLGRQRRKVQAEVGGDGCRASVISSSGNSLIGKGVALEPHTRQWWGEGRLQLWVNHSEGQRQRMQTLKVWLCYFVGLFVCMMLTLFF